jgi:hypothetical protein
LWEWAKEGGVPVKYYFGSSEGIGGTKNKKKK